jgi:hypothetical protein
LDSEVVLEGELDQVEEEEVSDLEVGAVGVEVAFATAHLQAQVEDEWETAGLVEEADRGVIVLEAVVVAVGAVESEDTVIVLEVAPADSVLEALELVSQAEAVDSRARVRTLVQVPVKAGAVDNPAHQVKTDPNENMKIIVTRMLMAEEAMMTIIRNQDIKQHFPHPLFLQPLLRSLAPLFVLLFF